MSDEHNYRDEEYWSNIYNYEMYEQELEESGSSSGVIFSKSFLIWLVALVIASNISKDLGIVVVFAGLASLVINCMRR